MSIPNISIQNVVANVGRGSVHPVIENRTFADVKVVATNLIRIGGLRFPMELTGHIAPEPRRIAQRLGVHFLILFHRTDVGLIGDGLVGIEDLVRHGEVVICLLTISR